VFGWGLRLYIDARTPPPGAYPVSVEAQGGVWRFTHIALDSKQESGELHVPADRPVRLAMRPGPRAHSLWLPAFRLRLAATPMAEHAVWFQARGPRPSRAG
jgi:cytochrome c oxidase subunit 2